MNSNLNNNSSFVSAEGAYDKRLEESAQQLLMAVVVNGMEVPGQREASEESNTGGYSSDDSETSGPEEEEEEEEEEDGTSLSVVEEGRSSTVEEEEPSSLSSSSLTSENSNEDEEDDSEDFSEDDGDDSLDHEIAYLREKQALLTRAIRVIKEEEAYDVSRARRPVEQDEEPAIWKEARSVLNRIHRQEGTSTTSRKHDRSTISVVDSSSSSSSSHKRPKIDLSSVSMRVSSHAELLPAQMIVSSSASTSSSSPSCNLSIRKALKVPFERLPGPWMAKALVHSLTTTTTPSAITDTTTTSSTATTRWEIVQDPCIGPIVIPPSSISLRSNNSISLEDALSITPVAQLVALSTPPFHVVYMNKAFSVLTGKDVGMEVIGQPVESILQVTQDMDDNDNDSNSLSENGDVLESRLSLQGNHHQVCHIKVTPIVDQSRRNGAGMSHLLIQIIPQQDNSVSAKETQRLKTVGGTNAVGPTSMPSHLLGTVG